MDQKNTNMYILLRNYYQNSSPWNRSSNTLANLTYGLCEALPRGRARDLPLVAEFMKTNDEQGGPDETTDPSSSLKINWIARSRPDLSKLHDIPPKSTRSIYTGHHSMQEIDRLIFVWGMDTVVKSPAGPCRLMSKVALGKTKYITIDVGNVYFINCVIFHSLQHNTTPTSNLRFAHFEALIASDARCWIARRESGFPGTKKDKFFRWQSY